MEEETETDTNEIKTAGTAEEIHGEEEEDIKVVVVVGGGEEAEADTVVTAAIAMTSFINSSPAFGPTSCPVRLRD